MPAAPLGDTKAEGELWFVGGKRAFEMLGWKPLDLGETMAERAIEEWLGVDPKGPSVWNVQESAFAWARGSNVPALEE